MPANTPAPGCLNWLLWNFALDWNGEKRGSLSLLTWGLWVTLWQPLADTPGWHYLAYWVSWLPFQADFFWGPLMLAFGWWHFRLALDTYNLSRNRVNAALWNGGVCCFFTVALFLSTPGTTGIAVYGWLAWDGFATYYQLNLRLRGRCGL